MAVTYNSAFLIVDSDPNLDASIQGDQKQTIAYFDDGTNPPILYYFDDTQDAGEKWLSFCNLSAGVTSGPTLPTFDADLHCKGQEFVKLNEHLHVLETYTSNGTAWVKAFDNHPATLTAATLTTFSGTDHPVGTEFIVNDGAGTLENYISDGETGWILTSCCRPHPEVGSGISATPPTFDSAVHIKGYVYVTVYENGRTGDAHISNGSQWLLMSEEGAAPQVGTSLPTAGSSTTPPGTVFVVQDGSGNTVSTHVSGGGSEYGTWLTTAEVSNSDLSVTESNTTNIITSSDGTDATLTAASTSKAGLMTKAMFDEHVLNNAKVSNVDETLTSISVAANVITYTDEDGNDTTIDLSTYLDDTNLARLTSGSLNGTTGVATFTRDDASTFTIDMSAFLDAITLNNTLTSTSTTEGLTAAQGKALKDLIDALPTSDTVDMGSGFKIANSAGTDQFTVTENEEIRFEGSGATSVTFDASTQKVTISSTDNNTDTVYTHPTHPGDDASIDTGALTGATVISDLDLNITTDTLGHVTDANATVSTRTLTLANLGFTGDADATSGGKFVDGTDTDDAVYTTGNVGIGDDNPDGTLSVKGVGAQVIIDDTDSTDNPRLRFRESGGTSASIYTDAGELIFDSGTSEKMRIDSSGNVGIGTTSPNSRLEVSDTFPVLRLTNESSTSTIGDVVSSIEFYNSDTSGNYPAVGAAIKSINESAFGNANALGFFTNSDSASENEYMRIDSSGSVGVGTASPDALFHISQGANSTATNLIIENTDTSILDTEDLAKIEFKSNDISTNGVGVAASIRTVAESAGNRFGIAFNTKNLSAETEKMRIAYTGNVGIGTTSPTEELHVSGNARVTGAYYDSNNSPGTSGQILYSTATGTDWATPDIPISPTWTLSGDSGTDQNIGVFDTVDLAGGNGISTVASATDTLTINLDDTAVTAGAYTSANITVDAQGRITAATNGSGVKFVDGTDTDDAVYTTGNVGIGTTDPDALLNVETLNAGARSTVLKLSNTSSTTGTDASIDFRVAGSNTITNRIGNIIESDSTRSTYFSTYNGGLSEKMRIIGNGNVGIGTTSPDATLAIGDNTSTGNYIKVEGSSSDNTYTVFEGKRKYPKLILNDTIGSSFNLWNLGNTLRFGTSTSSAANAAWYTKSGVAGNVIFNGSVGIGTTTPGSKLEVNGSAEFNQDGDVMFYAGDGSSDYNWGIGDFDSGAGGAYIKNSSGEVEVYTDGSIAATFKTDNRISGVADPTGAQDVATKSYVDDLKVAISIAVSDEETDLAVGTSNVTFRMPYAMTLTEVRASLNRAPGGSTLIVDINDTASTILSTKLSIDIGEKTSTTAATPAVISDTELVDDAEITIDIDQIGSSDAGKGLKVTLIGTRAIPI